MATPMLTAVIAAGHDPVALAETLAALVPAAVDGFLRRVLVVTNGPAVGDISVLIDASGADHCAAAGDALALWRAGLAVAAPGWRLCLDAGMIPVGDWPEAVVRYCARPDAGPAVFAIGGAWRLRIAAGVTRLTGRPYPAAGLLLREAAIPARLQLTRLRARLEDRRAPR